MDKKWTCSIFLNVKKYYFAKFLILLNMKNVMNISTFTSEKVKNRNKRILLEVALFLNKELFDEKKISYKLFKITEDNILRELKSHS